MVVSTLSLQVRSPTVLNTAQKQETSNPILDAIAKTDPDKASALREERASADALLQQLQSSRADNSEQRKQKAREKIDRLKAQIQALRFMAAGDPKTVARQAARLARELAQAAREYSGAGGGSDVFSAPPPTAEGLQVATQTETQTATQEQTRAETTATENIPQAGTLSGQTATAQADAEFVKEASKLLNDLKKIVEDAKRKIQQQDGNRAANDVLQAENSLASAEQSLNGIFSGALATATSAIDILA
jgi:hypothetical protein